MHVQSYWNVDGALITLLNEQLAASALFFSDWMFEAVRYGSRTVSLLIKFFSANQLSANIGSSLFLNMSSYGQQKRIFAIGHVSFINFFYLVILHLMSYLCRIFATFLPLNKNLNLNSIVSFCNQYSLFYVRLTFICLGKPGSAVTRIDLTSEMTKSRMTRQYLFNSFLTQAIKRSIYVSFFFVLR